MSEQQAEAIQTEAIQGSSGSVGAGSTPSSETASEKTADLAVSVLEAPAIAPNHDVLPKVDFAKAEDPKAEDPKPDAPIVEAAKADLSEPPHTTGKLMILSPGARVWQDHPANAEVKSETRTAPPPVASKRSFGTMAAMLALATIAGAVGGGLATSGLTHTTEVAATTPTAGTLQASIARIDAEMAALKSGLDHTSKQGVNQFNKTNDRLDKVEKAQAEPAARLAKLTEAVDKLRATPAPVTVAAAPVAAAPAVQKDVTGSVLPPHAVAAATPAEGAAPPSAMPPKLEVGRLPTLEGWSLAEVGYGGALIRGRRGTFEVYAGDFVPGVGRIDAIRKQDGQWVVVTSKGLIVRQ